MGSGRAPVLSYSLRDRSQGKYAKTLFIYANSAGKPLFSAIRSLVQPPVKL